MTNRSNHVDPITRSVLQHRLTGIVEEMGEAMLRTTYSQILNSSRDFSTALCGRAGRLLAQAEHVPVHVGALPWAPRRCRTISATTCGRGTWSWRTTRITAAAICRT